MADLEVTSARRLQDWIDWSELNDWYWSTIMITADTRLIITSLSRITSMTGISKISSSPPMASKRSIDSFLEDQEHKSQHQSAGSSLPLSHVKAKSQQFHNAARSQVLNSSTEACLVTGAHWAYCMWAWSQLRESDRLIESPKLCLARGFEYHACQQGLGRKTFELY